MPENPYEFSLLDYDRSATARLLGVSHDVANFDYTLATATPTGRKWGLSGSWKSGWAIRPDAVDEVLAVDDLGRAAAWVRRYNGPPGTGFIRVQRVGAGSPPESFLESVRIVAEYFPLAETTGVPSR